MQGISGSRLLFLISIGVFAVVWGAAAIFADSPLPAHFDFFGEVNRWDSKWAVLGTLAAIAAFMAAIFGGMGAFIRHAPASSINIPNKQRKDYWTAPENRDEYNRRATGDLQVIGAAVMLLLSYVLGVFALAGGPVNTLYLAVPTGLFLAVILGYVVYMAAGPRYRIPDDEPH